MGNDRHLFPGGNTPAGFFSYYQYILPQDKANHIFCIKGGPGVGKSTFMKKIGEAMGEKGHSVEYMHCSSDPNSLDGLVIPELRIAFIDGTSPHVVDPKNPGAVDEVINLGECWSLSGIKEHREEIMTTNSAVGKHFARVYRYLAAAKEVYNDQIAIQTDYSDATGIDIELESILPLMSEHRKGIKLGRERKLFASAITPDGMMNYLDSLAAGCKSVYGLNGSWVLAAGFLKRLSDEAIQRGLDVEQYYCPMEPGVKIEHMIIPALSMAFFTTNQFHTVSADDMQMIDFDKYVDKQAMGSHMDVLIKDGQYFLVLMREAMATLNQAKKLHDYMETFYIPNMDFDAIAARREEIIARILN